MALLFNRKMAEASGMNADPFYFSILFLTDLIVAFSLQFVGGLLVFALIMNFAASANQITYDIKKIMVLSLVIEVFCCFIRYFLSLQFDLPIGTSIVIITALFFACSVLLSKKRRKGKRFHFSK